MKENLALKPIIPPVTHATHAVKHHRRNQLAALIGAALLGFGWLMLTSSAGSATTATGQINGLTGEFSSGSLSGWKERSFAGNSEYELVDEQGTQVLRGSTNGKASILYTEQEVDLKTTPLIEWSWKVDRTYGGIDQRSRQGDDFPARLYVVAKTGFLPWDTLAINYVWSTDAALDDSWANPFTNKAHMVVVQTGNQHVGSWVTQQRNIAEDFKTYFDAEITQLSGYAVMIDGDNANKEGIAWFGKIQFSAN